MDSVGAGRYRLLDQLGRGGMGEVWKAVDTVIGRTVAIKIVRGAGDVLDSELGRRFQREVRTLASLNHPNIVTAYDFGIDPATSMPYLVMELIEGGSIASEQADRLARGAGPFPVDRVLAIGQDVCAGLGAAHAAGVVHRDLKPANLMTVGQTGRVKLVDFGIVAGADFTRLTQAGGFPGTVCYMAPEQMTSGVVDGRTDLYALGCVLFELLTGRSPYTAESPAQFLMAHLHQAPAPLRRLLPQAPPALEALLLRLLAKDPAGRPPDAAAVMAMLAAIGPAPAPWTPPVALDPAVTPPSPSTVQAGLAARGRPIAVPGGAATLRRTDDLETSPPASGPLGGRLGRGRRVMLAGAVAVVVVGGGTALVLSGGSGRPGTPVTGTGNTTRGGAGAGTKSPGAVAGHPQCGYHLAFLGPLTGGIGSLGQGMAQGAQLAVDQFNTRYGSNCVQLVRYDSQGAASKAAGVAAQVVADPQALGVIGPIYSPESETADPVLNAAGISLVSPAATFADLSAQGWRVFHRAIGSDKDVPPAAARYIRQVLGAARVYVIDDRSSYGAGLAGGVRTALADLVVGSATVAAEGKQTDFSVIVTDVIASGATVLFYGGFYTNAGRLRRQLTTAGWRGTLVGGDAMMDPGFVTAAGRTAAEGTLDVAPDPPISAAHGTFAADFHAAFGVAPADSSDVAYDVANMYLQGILAGRTSTASMLAWINAYDADGAAGHYRFTRTGDLDPADSSVWIYTVSAGVFVPTALAPPA